MKHDETGTRRSTDEVELKLRLPDAAALAAVRRAAGDGAARTVLQRNAFLDTQGLALHRAEHVLRLREEDGAFTLTAKGPETRTLDGALARRAEAEVSVTPDAARAILAGTAQALDFLKALPDARDVATRIEALADGRRLRVVGRMQNERCRQPVELEVDGRVLPLLLELDATTMPDGSVDYELEVELDGNADAALARRAVERLLARAGVAGTPSSSKAVRFFERLRAR